jgi:hypothetical protein
LCFPSIEIVLYDKSLICHDRALPNVLWNNNE